MDKSLCLCEYLQTPIDNRIPMHIVFHPKEIAKTTNTGHFLIKIFSKISSSVYPQSNIDAIFEGVDDREQRQPVLVFPDHCAPQKEHGNDSCIAAGSELINLGSAGELQARSRVLHALDPQRLLLVFVDGTWNQALNMVAKCPVLQSLPKFPLPLNPTQSFCGRMPHLDYKQMEKIDNLWEEPIGQGMATYEAAARAMSWLAGYQACAGLWELIKARAHRLEWVRGLRGADSVFGGLPPGAKKGRHLAG